MENVHPLQRREEISAEARTWVLKFNGDVPPTQENIAALREWVSRSNVHRQELERAESFWCDADLLQELAVPVKRNRIKMRFRMPRRLIDALLLFRHQGALVAAGLLMAVTLSYFLHPFFQGGGNGVYTTAIGEQRILTLRDQSKIELDTNSRVQVAYEEGRRKIYLQQGKAYFKVAKNPNRPFEVYAGGDMVRAVGTAFVVDISRSNAKVIVDEGRVNLYREKAGEVEKPETALSRQSSRYAVDTTGVRDGPPDHALLSLEKGQSIELGRGAVRALDADELSKALSWRKGVLIFTDDPLRDVIADVSRYTEIKIEVVDPALNDLKVGGRFKVGQLDALFDALEAGFGVQVSYVDKNHIKLSRPFIRKTAS